jgi:hypothetical protein
MYQHIQKAHLIYRVGFFVFIMPCGVIMVLASFPDKKPAHVNTVYYKINNPDFGGCKKSPLNL